MSPIKSCPQIISSPAKVPPPKHPLQFALEMSLHHTVTIGNHILDTYLNVILVIKYLPQCNIMQDIKCMITLTKQIIYMIIALRVNAKILR